MKWMEAIQELAGEVRQADQTIMFCCEFLIWPHRRKKLAPTPALMELSSQQLAWSANGSLHFVCCCKDLSLSFSSQLRWFYPAKVQLQFDFWNRIQFPIEWRVAGGDLLEQNPLWVDHDHDHPPLIMLLVMRRITRWWWRIIANICWDRT